MEISTILPRRRDSDEVRSATEFCGGNVPRTWGGVYDHVFLEKAAELMIAPKGFEYYSLYPSLTERQPEGLVTSKQWLTIEELGEVASGLVEKIKESDMEGTGKFKPEDTGWQEKASDVTFVNRMDNAPFECLLARKQQVIAIPSDLFVC